MRIKLKEGKQKELIEKAKSKSTWEKLAKQLNLNSHYLSEELRKEERLLPEKIYEKLCLFSKINYDMHIEEKLDDNWGRAKGGKKSTGYSQIIKKSIKNEKLAELIGIILGDGHIERRIEGTKIRCYAVKIAGHIKQDKDYLSNYVSKIIEEIYEKNRILERIITMELSGSQYMEKELLMI